MKMTMTQKILAAHSGKPYVEAGELILADVDLVLGNDITAPIAIDEFEKMGTNSVFDREKIALIPDHFIPCKDIASAQQAKMMREFAYQYNIKHYYEAGRTGIEHAFLPEIGLISPGKLIVGADSHTCTYGALNAFSTGVGSTDMAYAMATGKCWFKVPEAIRFNLHGEKKKWVSGKDVILHIIGMIGVDGALYQSMEFGGEGLKSLSADERLTMANMAIEAGAKNGIFEADEITMRYLEEVNAEPGTINKADDGASYQKVYDIDLGRIEPCVAFPHLPSNVKNAKDATDIKIDQVVIGSCTNGRLSDMAVAAQILKGRKVHPSVRLIIIPATQKIWRECANLGYFDIFAESGASVSTPTCGPCLGGYMGILAQGERALSTTNRNFVGRMGHPESEVYLASPAVAAATAVFGRIASPDEIEDGRN